jgi:hypothetical protein
LILTPHTYSATVWWSSAIAIPNKPAAEKLAEKGSSGDLGLWISLQPGLSESAFSTKDVCGSRV